MRNNLSSQITLTRIPERYYNPENAYEYSSLTRFEKIRTHIYATMDEGSAALAKEIADEIRENQKAKKKFVMAIPGGRSPHTLFQHLIQIHKEEKLSFKNVIVFLLYEFYPLTNAANSNLHQLQEVFLNHVDIPKKNIYSPDGFMNKNDIYEFCQRYEQQINECGGIDYMLLGIGQGGTIGLNSAGTSVASRTHLVLMDAASRKESAQLFSSIENVPAGVITMGLGTIMDAKKVVLISWGENKANIIRKTIENPVTDGLPASCLQHHANAKAVIDLSSAYDLTRISHPWLVTTCEWDNKLIRRAIVWLCQLTNKPILKLTNKDYSEHGLGELLALYGSAYNVNIKIFNDIQHTITGWPGGKPNADDSNRPERAEPYPKKVILFSPHPDDDVISMGGTLRRLCDQHHDVHVAYQTSGNIAVGDEEVIRYCEYLCDVSDKYSPKDKTIRKKAEEIIQYLRYDKKEDGTPERPDVLFMKGTIRREEARHGCRYSGVKDENVHFLDLPFYETGLVKKNPISQKDVDIIKKLLLDVKPNQIFVAGDLADPHGTHKVCLDAALAAIDEVKDQKWMKDCRVWMYRGAWAEWEMDHIEMAVPISPEELRYKRNAILKHQSQAESAPFLGDDERLFWQRAEDRNRATAEMYKQLGLASYEAIEAFVQYIPIR
ncbi:glucosamine-6-phosphate deaminase [Tannerella sp.]|uniref:glucosamine-6-phosphate deaminase n=1 Tax=Tannerella sp. TaxID=2382127 RepID=UPI0026DCD21A|nr:glucosamine-6-phosphate deaminase [Tannerella sp.]MDO4702536.1 glucosamine-6-phosphate deaminase [Tannerella sp.]